MITQARWLRRLVAAVLSAGLAGSLAQATAGAVPATRPPSTAASRPASPAASTPVLQTKFESGDPIGGLLIAMAVRYRVMVVELTPVKAYVLREFTLPDKLEDALSLLTQTLEAQGYSMMQSGGTDGLTLRIGTTKQMQAAQQAEGPVTYGREPEKIDVSKPKRLVTHIMPVEHPAMIEALRRNASSDADVTAEVIGSAQTGLSLLILGPAQKVQTVVVNLCKIDAAEKVNLVARTLGLRRLNAEETALKLNEAFARGTAAMKATAEPRTNAIIITGPEEQVLSVMMELTAAELSRGPADVPIAPQIRPVVPAPRESPTLDKGAGND